MKTKFDRGMFTIGSGYVGYGIQFYWPEINLERTHIFNQPKTLTGFCLRFGTTIRFVFNLKENQYSLAGKFLGFGMGFQYIEPEKIIKN